MPWPCSAPASSVRRISRSSVPGSNPSRALWVDILPESADAPVKCQGKADAVSVLQAAGLLVPQHAHGCDGRRAP